MKGFTFNDDGGIHQVTSVRGSLSSYNGLITNGDFANERSSGNGQLFVELSMDPLTEDHSSTLTHNQPFSGSFSLSSPMSISQRARNQYFTLETIDDSIIVDNPSAIALVSITQSTTIVTIVLATATDIAANEWFDIYGLVDSRLNYSNACVVTLSLDKKTITATVADDIAMPSLTIATVNGSGYFKRQKRAIQAKNGAAIRFTGSSAAVAAYLLASSGSNVRASGTYRGVHAITCNTTAPVISNGTNGQFEIKPNGAFEIIVDRGIVTFEDYGVDSATSQSTLRMYYDSSSPDTNITFNSQLRATSPKSMARPVGKIVSAVKTASTTATITTSDAHGLVVGNVVDIHGVRDQTNFANQTAMTVVSVPTATTFTVVMTTSATATSYSGGVILRNGSIDITGRVPQVIQSISIDTNNIVTVIGSAAWATMVVGEYVNLYGVRDNATGADLGLDGAYLLIDMTTTTAKLIAIKDINNLDVKNGSAINVSPTLTTLASTNCGGMVIMRTTLRIHDLNVNQYQCDTVKLLGQGENRTDLAIGVVAMGGSITAGEGTPYNPTVSNLVSAATTNGSSIKTSAGKVYSAVFTNYGAAAVFVKLYNKASAPTIGTDVPLVTITIPAYSDKEIEFGRMGMFMSTGIAIAMTNLQPIADVTAIAANQVTSTITYV